MKIRILLLPLLLLTACGSGPFSNPLIQHINVTLSPSDLNLVQGGSARVQVSGTLAGSSTVLTGLTVAPLEVPAGLSVTASSGAVTLSASSSAAPGTYSVPLDVTTFGGRGQGLLAVTVSAPVTPSYQVAFSPVSPTLIQGSSVRVSLVATRAGQPEPGVQVISVTGALSVTSDPADPLGFTLTAAPTQVPGDYTMQVTTGDGSVTKVTPLIVQVTAAGGN